MAAITALIFLGNPHPNNGGLRPLLNIQYSEGGRSAFIFPRRTGAGRDTPSRFKLIPSLENMLDDLFLIVAYREIQDPTTIKLLNGFCKNDIEEDGRIEIYESLTPNQRLELYEHIKNITNFPKVGICLFTGSGLMKTVHYIKEYKMKYEVCTPTLKSI